MASWYGRSKILGRCVDRNKKPWYRRYTDSLYGRTYRISWCSEERSFPDTHIQHCIVHMVRSSTKFVSYKDLKAVCKDLKEVSQLLQLMPDMMHWKRSGRSGMTNTRWSRRHGRGTGMSSSSFQLPDGHTKSYLHNKRYWVVELQFTKNHTQ